LFKSLAWKPLGPHFITIDKSLKYKYELLKVNRLSQQTTQTILTLKNEFTTPSNSNKVEN